MDAKKRIRDLDDPFVEPPMGGSFASMRELTAAGYNDIGPEEDTTVTSTGITAAGPAVTGEGDYSTLATNGTPWEGVLMVEGEETGDGRMFALNSITWPDPATTIIPLRRNIEDSHGGVPTTKAVLVGRINEIWRSPDNPALVMGRGVLDSSGVHGAETERLMRDNFLNGISIDPDDIKDADVELVFPEGDTDASPEDELMQMFAAPELTIFHAGRIRGATLCDIPAFVEAKVHLSDVTVAATVASASAAHFDGLSERPWNGAAHESRLAGRMDMRVARTAFAHTSGLGGSVAKASARFLHHEIGDESTVGHANLAACLAGMRAINAGRAATMSDTEQRAAYEHMASHVRTAGLVPSPYEGGQTVLASGFDGLVRPPAEWFANPQLTAVTPLTITEEGRVFGHGAAWGTCHTSFGDACVTPPTEGEHSYFRLGEVVTASGDRVAVGHITLGTGHASIHGLSPSRAAEHYDNTGTVVAVVASGEDDHGIWIAGAVRPGTPEARVQELRAASLSGDWRRIGGKLRLVAFLAVNRPGFPIPRTATFVSKSEQLSLVAAGVVTQDMRPVARDGAAAKMALGRIARGIGRDPETRMRELRERVRGS